MLQANVRDLIMSRDQIGILVTNRTGRCGSSPQLRVDVKLVREGSIPSLLSNAGVSIPGGEPGYAPGDCSGDQILFSERRKIAEQADSIMHAHNIARDTFGVVCALSMIGSLKRPNARLTLSGDAAGIHKHDEPE
jgi:hypothetical protein